jgi:hypothetical protein
VYLYLADNGNEFVGRYSRGANTPVMISLTAVPGLGEALFPCFRAYLARLTPQSLFYAAAHIACACGCGHGGRRKSNTSRKVQT